MVTRFRWANPSRGPPIQQEAVPRPEAQQLWSLAGPHTQLSGNARDCDGQTQRATSTFTDRTSVTST